MTLLQTILPKALASFINVLFVLTISSPIYILYGLDWWRLFCLMLFFAYSLVLRNRCLGMIVARTRLNLPTNPLYAFLYTMSFATLLWWIWVPFDVAMINAIFIQFPCLMIYGNTLHGKIANRETRRDQDSDCR